MIDYNYKRVIPRDLFNEAKLLKCMGRLALLQQDRNITTLRLSETGKPFRIGLHEDNYLTTNLNVYIQYEVVRVGCMYNSQLPYPLLCMYGDEECYVFDDEGEFTADFQKLL